MNSKIKFAIITQGMSHIVEPLIYSHKLMAIVEDAPRGYNKKLILRIFRLLDIILPFNLRRSLVKFSSNKKVDYFFYKGDNRQALLDFLKPLELDVILVYSMSRLLKKEIFTLPKYGTLNLHPSLLPKYPGRNPWFWQYYNFERTSGVTLHFIDEGQDTGDIVYQDEYSIYPGMSSYKMQDVAIKQLGVGLLLKALDNLSRNMELPRKAQTEELGALARSVGNNEELIDWDIWPVERVWHLLRGTETWYFPIQRPSGVYIGQRWKVGDYELQKDISDKPGSVYRVTSEKYYLQTRNGKIFIRPTKSFKEFIKYLLNL